MTDRPRLDAATYDAYAIPIYDALWRKGEWPYRGFVRVEAQCGRCGDVFNPSQADVVGADIWDGAIVVKHFVRGDGETACGGYGQIIGAR